MPWELSAPVAHFGHFGLVAGSRVCIMMDEYFYYTDMIR